ncbi:MAG: hypothetical protein HC882_00725 [Acidobacteria bacterium]|nr:hypothetical protein [Acidobacteriota bacterium]
MGDHPVKRKLRNDILPYLATARRLRRQWFYSSYVVFGYTTDLLVALSAVGIGWPAVSNILANQEATNSSPGTLAQAMASVPAQLAYPLAILLILWIVWRVAFNREDGQKKAVLAKSCALAMRQAEARLPRVLGDPNPMPAITKLYDEILWPTADRGIQEGAWPWTPFAPSIDAEVEKQLSEICQKYESQWAQVDSTSQRVVPSAGERHE